MASPVSGDLLARSRANSSADDDLENDQAGVLQELQFLHKYNKVLLLFLLSHPGCFYSVLNSLQIL